MSIGLLGQKIGMTSVYDARGRLCPVTVIAAGDNVLLRRLTEGNEGYSAVQLGFDSQKESREDQKRTDTGIRELRELHKNTEEKLNALIHTVDRLIRHRNGDGNEA